MSSSKEKKQPRFKQITVLALITLFQIICCACVVFREKEINTTVIYIYLAYIAVEWIYMALGTIITGHDYFELEAIGFFLSGIGLTVCSSISNNFAKNQFITIIAGLIVYLAVILLTKDPNFASKLRVPAALGSLALLAVNLIIAPEVNGTKNWIEIGNSFSIQPSEFVKVAFVLVGAVSLEKLLSITSLSKYILFSLACIGMLFIMKDFGTALIFFFTFILIAFMRSGDIRTIALICTAALIGCILILCFKDTVAARFDTYRHIWDDMDNKGYQQTRALIYIACGGLQGLGIGEGHVRDIYAASTDMVFALICEEMGLIIGIAILLCFAGIALFAIQASKTAGSTFYAIAAVSAAGMLLFQLSLNVFGLTDLLPFTGVTLPFVSRGGSSMICSWGLLAFIRMAGAPFVVPKPDPNPVSLTKTISDRVRRTSRQGGRSA